MTLLKICDVHASRKRMTGKPLRKLAIALMLGCCLPMMAQSAKTAREKLAQRMFFFWYKHEERRHIEQELKRIGRPDLISKLYCKGK